VLEGVQNCAGRICIESRPPSVTAYAPGSKKATVQQARIRTGRAPAYGGGEMRIAICVLRAAGNNPTLADRKAAAGYLKQSIEVTARLECLPAARAGKKGSIAARCRRYSGHKKRRGRPGSAPLTTSGE